MGGGGGEEVSCGNLLPGGWKTWIDVASDNVGIWVLQLLPVQHVISHWPNDHRLFALIKPPIVEQAIFFSEIINTT